MMTADEVLGLMRQVEAWGRRHNLDLPATFSTDLVESYRSAAILRESVEVLLRESASEADAVEALAKIEAWGIGDLLDHLQRLEQTLGGVINQLP
jgi:hypothetical protein